MTNAELFKKIFGIYAEEFWAYPKEEMLNWINSDAPDTDAGDLISRQAAIDVLIAEGRNVDSRYLESERIIHESDAVEAISLLSPAQSERKVGKWIRNNDSDHPWKCSVCGRGYTDYILNYCPNCGAEMEGGEDA